MAYPTDFYETLVAAATAATSSLQLPNTMVDNVYTQYSPKWEGALGQTLNIDIPVVNISNASDEGAGGVTGVAPTDTKSTITINHKYASNRKIPFYENTLSATELGQVYVAPVIEEVLRMLDNAICALMLTANFTTNTSITGGADIFTRQNLATAWANLRTQGVPVGNPAMTKFITHPIVVGNMMAATEFANESVVGINAAEIDQRQAKILPQFGFELLDDPYMPVPSAGVYNGLAFHKWFFGLRTVSPRLDNGGRVNQTVVFPKANVPVVVETWYEPKDQARYIHAFIICGYAIVRENLAQFMVTT